MHYPDKSQRGNSLKTSTKLKHIDDKYLQKCITYWMKSKKIMTSLSAKKTIIKKKKLTQKSDFLYSKIYFLTKSKTKISDLDQSLKSGPRVPTPELTNNELVAKRYRPLIYGKANLTNNVKGKICPLCV